MDLQPVFTFLPAVLAGLIGVWVSFSIFQLRKWRKRDLEKIEALQESVENMCKALDVLSDTATRTYNDQWVGR